MTYSFKPQKALHLYLELDKKRTKIQDDTFMVFEKYDGWYGCKHVDSATENMPMVLSRAGRFIPSMASFSASMAHAESANQFDTKGVLIFEILVEGSPVFKDLNGILNRSKAPCQAENAYIMVHDFIVEGKESMPFIERYAIAKQYVAQCNHDRVKLATVYAVGGHSAVQQVAENVWKRTNANLSKEGAIGKNINAPYSQGKRNKDVIKVKSEVSLEMVVYGWEKGNGKYENTLGRLLVRQKNGRQHSVSGMSDDDRTLWYNDFSIINGSVVQIDAMQILANGSLREGRFKAVRYDKDVSEID